MTSGTDCFIFCHHFNFISSTKLFFRAKDFYSFIAIIPKFNFVFNLQQILEI